jgi:hypothetical protein
MEKKGLPPTAHTVSRIEIEEEKGHYTSVDHALRAREM